MERLTIKGHTCDILRCTRFNCDGDHDKTQECDTKKCYERLREYENTGLTPEVCAEYKKFEDELVSSGKSFQHIIDLLEAEKNGRLVVLPCKVGDTVYVRQAAVGFGYELDKYKEEILIGKITSFRVTETQRFMRIKFRTTKNGRARFGRFYFASIGKTVFLTREEAEEALAKKGGREDEWDYFYKRTVRKG